MSYNRCWKGPPTDSRQSVMRLRTFLRTLLIVSLLYLSAKLFTHCTRLTRESIEFLFFIENLTLSNQPKMKVEGIEVRTVRWSGVRCPSDDDSTSKLLIEKCENFAYTKCGATSCIHHKEEHVDPYRSLGQTVCYMLWHIANWGNKHYLLISNKHNYQGSRGILKLCYR